VPVTVCKFESCSGHEKNETAVEKKSIAVFLLLNKEKCHFDIN
jgi:hypothetical protein